VGAAAAHAAVDNPQMSDPAPSATPNNNAPPATVRTWREALRLYLQPASLRMLALGFSAGLPLLLVLGTLSFRLREAGIDRSTIGYLSWVGLAYGVKWMWAPLVDRLPIPWLTRQLGRRRSWLLVSQLVIAFGLVGMALNDPSQLLGPLVACALAVAIASATQDIALDAYRIESAEVNAQAALAACYQTGYRLAMIWAGAGVLWIAAGVQGETCELSKVIKQLPYDAHAWKIAYLIMAASMLPGILMVLFSPEPVHAPFKPARSLFEWLQGALISPFADFWLRYRWHAVMFLSLISVYRISDVVMGIMANPFYVDMGFNKCEVASVTKVYGVIMTLVGAFVGGVLSARLGVMRVLMLGAALSAASNLLFVWLSGVGHDVQALVWVISADNLASGIASAAFIAYLSSLTNISYSATQYALLSSMMLLLPKFIAGFSGDFVDAHGYASFFTATAWLGLPVLVLVALASRVHARKA
jgi:PAT family beta-lactamase induction signal transducer AmpG